MKKFIPLISIFAVILAYTIGSQVYLGSWDTMHAMRHFMGAFFIVFGAFKVFNWKGFVAAYQMYDVVAQRSRTYAYLYPIIELVLGFAYILNIAPFTTNLVTLVVMGISSIGVFQSLRKKEEIQCACLGAVFKIPMTKVTLLEDVLMVVMALFMLVIIK
jgi:hypothetical protein